MLSLHIASWKASLLKYLIIKPCVLLFQKKIKELEEQEAKGILVALPGGKYPKKQLNAFLKKYPQPK